jgi:hypothetical protein
MCPLRSQSSGTLQRSLAGPSFVTHWRFSHSKWVMGFADEEDEDDVFNPQQ